MSPDSDGYEDISGDSHTNIPISNIDVKKRNFMKTINFETVRRNNGGANSAEHSMDSDDLEEQSLVCKCCLLLSYLATFQFELHK